MNNEGTIFERGKQNCCPACGTDTCWVQLRPYQNQVSGHHRVMIFDDNTICKPLMSKEYSFYQNIPSKLLQFVPKMKGIAKVCARTDSNGHDYLFAIKTAKEPLSKLTCVCEERRVFDISPIKSNGLQTNNECKWKYKAGKESESSIEKVYDQHPWVEKVQQMSFARNMHKTTGSELILLENVGARFKRPCIMDVKMGVRQYGDDATEIKIKDHEERCEMSTSSSLGVRLCGMQVYDPMSRIYTYTDKYTGRGLSDSDLQEYLKKFLNNGDRTNVIAEFLGSLKSLCECVQYLPSCRLFCSSLLLMYEGEIEAKTEPITEVRMIDFANVSLYSEKYEGADEGYLFGLRNLIKLFENLAATRK